MPGTIIVSRLNGLGRGKKEQFTADELWLGTDTTCAVRFDPTWDKTVAPRHAVLRWQGDELWVEDSSRAGTLLNGQALRSQKLTPGTTLELGAGGPKVQIDFAAPQPLERPAPVHTLHAAPVVAAAPGHAATPAPAGRYLPRSRSARPKWLGPLLGLLALLLLLGIWWLVNRGSDDSRLARAVRAHEQAVGVVVLVPGSGNEARSVPMATAWAIAPNVFVTNSHVTVLVEEALQKNAAVFVAINRRPDLRYRVIRAITHPRYNQPLTNFEGTPPAVQPYDVGLLYIDGISAEVLPIASRSKLEALDSGERVAFLGFPMEGLAGGGTDHRNPVATMQSGIVTSVTDYWLAKAEFPQRVLIQHNLGATGGASGSPIFDRDGDVVAILAAGNVIGQVDMATGEQTRAPSAVMVNFAQRIDLLRDIYPAFPQ